MNLEKYRKTLLLIVLVALVLSFFIDYKKNTNYLQSDINEFKENYLTLIICAFAVIIISLYLYFVKFKIRDKLNGFLIFSFSTVLVLLSLKSIIISMFLIINRLGSQEELKIDYLYTKELNWLVNTENGKRDDEKVIVSSNRFKKYKKVKIDHRELITLHLKKGLLGINYLN